MENKLPQGWIESSLEDLLDSLESGSRPKGGVRGISDGIPSIGGEHLNYDGGFDFTNIKYVPKQFASQMNKGQIELEDILIVKDGATTGKTSFVNDKFPFSNAVVNEHVFICRPSKEINSKYLFWYLWSDEGNKRILENFKGSAQGGINKTFAPNTAVPLPPLPEQQRIVEKLDALMARISNSKTRLEKIPTLLKNFRQSVLAAAVSGELTKKWREQNDRAENGSVLLTKIKSERLKYLKKEKVYKSSSEIELPDLPEKWIWGNWSDYLDYSDDPFKRGPFGSALKKEIFVTKGYKVYEQYCPINDDCSYARYFITKEKFNELKKFAVKAGDFLISCSGVTLGRITQVPTEFDEGVINQAILRVRVNKTFFDTQFFKLLFRSPYFQKNIFENSTGSAIPNVKGVDELKAIPLPILTIEEQKEIVRKVEELFHFADSIEARYQKAKAWFDKLPQAILAKAFRGELVPQNENDEPASELLKRIQQVKQTNLLAGLPTGGRQAGHKPSSKAKRRKLYEDNDQLSR